MNNKIKVVQYGCGNIGKICLQQMVEKGYEIVGAIDVNPELVGKDIGEMLNLPTKLGVCVTDNADELFKNTKVDVAILTLFSEVDKIYPFIEKCLTYGINVITSADQFNAPYAMNEELTNKLDQLAKEKSVSVVGGGCQTLYFNMLKGVTKGIGEFNKLVITEKTNTENFGELASIAYGVNFTVEDFYKEFGNEEPTEENLSSLYPLARGFAESLGYTFKKVYETKRPLVLEKDMPSSIFGTIEKGKACGMESKVTIETLEGLIIEEVTIVKAYDAEVDGTVDFMSFEFFGTPNTRLVIEDMQSLEITACGCVNLVEPILNANPGLCNIMEL